MQGLESRALPREPLLVLVDRVSNSPGCPVARDAPVSASGLPL